RDLVLVMRKLQVHAAAMDVEWLAEQRGAHGRAFDMPARPSLAPWRGPFRLLGLRALPEDEVERIFLAGIDLDAFARAQLIERLAGKLAVAGKAAYREVDVARGRLIGEMVVLQAADERLHLRHVLRGARLVVGLQDA